VLVVIYLLIVRDRFFSERSVGILQGKAN